MKSVVAVNAAILKATGDTAAMVNAAAVDFVVAVVAAAAAAAAVVVAAAAACCCCRYGDRPWNPRSSASSFGTCVADTLLWLLQLLAG
jgi:hypothetical protein